MQRSKSKKESSKNCLVKKLTLEEAIAYAKECVDDTPCGQNHRQLAEWLNELRALKSTPFGNIAARRKALKVIRRMVNEELEDLVDGILHEYIDWLLAAATEQKGETDGSKNAMTQSATPAKPKELQCYHPCKHFLGCHCNNSTVKYGERGEYIDNPKVFICPQKIGCKLYEPDTTRPKIW